MNQFTASLVLKIIDDFEDECEAKEHTDTARVWEIFDAIRTLLGDEE